MSAAAVSSASVIWLLAVLLHAFAFCALWLSAMPWRLVQVAFSRIVVLLCLAGSCGLLVAREKITRRRGGAPMCVRRDVLGDSEMLGNILRCL